jgi:hypothetical protein
LSDHPDWESTTGVIARRAPGLAWLLPFRGYLTPSALWAAIGGLVIAIGYVINAQHELHNAQNDIRRHDESIGALQKQSDLLNEIRAEQAGMKSQLNDITEEMKRQRDWRDRIEQVAEAPPHARRK